VVAVCVEVMVSQVVPLRRCSETLCLVSGAPFDVIWPVIEKDFLTWAVNGAEMVRVVGVFVYVALVAVGVCVALVAVGVGMALVAVGVGMALVAVGVGVALVAVDVFVGVALVAVEVFASTTGAALQTNNTQTTSNTPTTITPFFSANIPHHLER
jgi:small-conductance mechanosensitive channel